MVRSRWMRSHGVISTGRSTQRDLDSAISWYELYGAISWLDLADASSTTHLGLGQWSELNGASPISLSLVSLRALSLSLSLFARLSLEIICSENRSVTYFLVKAIKHTVNWNGFSENSIFHAQPNTWWGVKSFPEMVLHQNKRNLNNKNKRKGGCYQYQKNQKDYKLKTIVPKNEKPHCTNWAPNKQKT